MLPVDLYAGGREHVRRHHLYARFTTMALYDLGRVPFEEPFPHLLLHGLLVKDGAKMSKSRGNVVNPDEYIASYGADNLRMYLLFCGDWQEGGDFSDAGLVGIVRFTERVWRTLTAPHEPGDGSADLRFLDRAVARVSGDVERLKFNTAIAALMELRHRLDKERPAMSSTQWERAAQTFTLLLAPFVPHLAEELWARLGGPYSVHAQPWPRYDPAALQQDQVTLVLQVDGKVRDRLDVPSDISDDEARALALANERVRAHLDDHEPRRVVVVPGRLVNVVS
jgi:leucyl-tRNA synthetase